MKRLSLWSASTLLLMLLSMPVGSAQAAAIPLDRAELGVVTAGLCNNCPPAEEPEESPPPKLVSRSWSIVSSTTGQPTQVSYTLVREFTNRSSTPLLQTVSIDEQCKATLTSGGAGVSSALGLSVGATKSCSQPTTLQMTVPSNKRVRLYRAGMRVTTTYAARQFAHYSDGTSTATGLSDTGVMTRTYMVYTTVTSSL